MADAPTPAGKGMFSLVTKPATLDMPAAGMGHDEDVPGAQPESVRAGHEPDFFDARGVIYVPVLVVVAAAVTYGFVTLLFNYFKPGQLEFAGTNPQAAGRASRAYNDRVRDISSQDPNAPVRQPRLEWVRTVDPKNPDEPTYYRSIKTPEQGNAPEIRPEDLRPENFVDWNTGERPLANYGWVSKDKGVARIPVAEAMKILATQKKLPAKPAGTPAGGTAVQPKLSNGGHGDDAPVEARQNLAPKPGQPQQAHDHKDEKKPEAKKDEKK